jgi:hypothetical protein
MCVLVASHVFSACYAFFFCQATNLLGICLVQRMSLMFQKLYNNWLLVDITRDNFLFIVLSGLIERMLLLYTIFIEIVLLTNNFKWYR